MNKTLKNMACDKTNSRAPDISGVDFLKVEAGAPYCQNFTFFNCIICQHHWFSSVAIFPSNSQTILKDESNQVSQFLLWTHLIFSLQSCYYKHFHPEYFSLTFHKPKKTMHITLDRNVKDFLVEISLGNIVTDCDQCQHILPSYIKYGSSKFTDIKL